MRCISRCICLVGKCVRLADVICWLYPKLSDIAGSSPWMPSYSHFIILYFISSHITMMTSSNGNIFRVTGHLCGEFTGPGEFLAQRPVTRSFDVFFDLRLNKRLRNQSWGWWFETQSRPLWRHCNAYTSQLTTSHLISSWLTSQTPISATPPAQIILGVSERNRVLHWSWSHRGTSSSLSNVGQMRWSETETNRTEASIRLGQVGLFEISCT